ncbi:unnamed protein product [Camellia sinensis]
MLTELIESRFFVTILRRKREISPNRLLCPGNSSSLVLQKWDWGDIYAWKIISVESILIFLDHEVERSSFSDWRTGGSMAGNSWPYFDPEYENLSIKINPPSGLYRQHYLQGLYSNQVVDSMNRPGILLEVVQILTDLDLTITKAYISSDGGWFMDGNKITDSKTIDFIEKALGPKGYTKDGSKSWPEKRVGMHSLGEHTAIELVGRDRPGLLSEISAVLANLHFNVVAAEVWTHNRRTACVLYVNDNTTCHAVDDPSRLSTMEEQLKNILRGCEDDEKVGCTSFSMGITHVDRRLHQMMLADRDYEGVTLATETDYPPLEPKITVDRCEEKGYSVVSVKCKDRAKLMFDIVCTLTDMQYVVFHANISSDGPYASQEASWKLTSTNGQNLHHEGNEKNEYYIRHMDGCTLDTEGEKERVVKCLEAAIRRRGLSLELCAKDRVGLLSEVTRVFRENGLSVTRAGVTTVGEQAMNVFYMSDASGNPVDTKTIETLRKEIGQTMMLNVKKIPTSAEAAEASGCTKTSFVFGSLLERFLA